MHLWSKLNQRAAKAAGDGVTYLLNRSGQIENT
jgi:hypothetical protein